MPRKLRSKILREITSVQRTTKTAPAGTNLKAGFRYELTASGDFFLPDVRTDLPDTSWVTVIAIGTAVPIVRVQGGNSELIIQGFKAPFQEDTNLELDINLEVTLRFDKLANRWRVQ